MGDLFVGAANGIIEINPGGTQTNFASNLEYCEGLAFDNAGNLYAVDGDTTVIKITPGGAQSTFASGLASAVDLKFNSASNLFVADEGRGADTGDITKITPDGTPSLFALAPGANGVVFDSAGNLYVSDDNGATGSYITKITPSGVQTNFASVLGYPREPAIDSAGNVFVADGESSIIKITMGGVQSTFASGLNYSEGLAFQPITPANLALGISTYSNQPTVFFPASIGANCVLQMTTNLTPPINWVTVSNGVSISGIIITNPPAAAFFRLH
jgi:glucose/arabinose dehydrogenase